MANQLYHPWQDLSGLLNQVDRWFLRGPGHGAAGAIPRVNAWHNESAVHITAEVPGLGPDDVELTVEGENLTIAGEIKRDETSEGANWHRAERSPRSFKRQFILPFAVDPDGVSATCRDGILTVELNRCPKVAPRKIAITG